jgi:hypothetical protein
MKSNRLQKYESKIEPEASPEQIKQAREWMVNQVMEAYDRLPANPAPVVESFQELARQAKFGISRQPTLIISGDEKPADAPAKATLIDTGINAKVDTKNILSDSDLDLLRKIQNGES